MSINLFDFNNVNLLIIRCYGSIFNLATQLTMQPNFNYLHSSMVIVQKNAY